MTNSHPHASDLHIAACRVLFDEAVRELGQSTVEEIVVRLGGAAALLTKREGWLSLSLFECFAQEVTERLGDGWIDRAVERSVDRTYGSLRARLLRLSASPVSAYRSFVLDAQRATRVVSLSIEHVGEHGLRLIARPVDGAPREGTRVLCRMRLAHARLIATLVDRAPADVLHLRCTHHGDGACIYEVDWGGTAATAGTDLRAEGARESMKQPVITQASASDEVSVSDLPGPSSDAVIALVVEHDREQRRSLADALAPHYRVKAVATGEDALREAAVLDPAVIVSGASLPDMPMQELCRALRKDPRTRALPVLIVARPSEPAAENQRPSSRPTDYIRSPMPHAELLDRVDLHVSLRRMAQDLALSERRAMLGVTAASIAHQLRNPLTTLIAGLPAMRARMRGRVDPQTFELVDVMIDCADRIERMSRDLMDLSRVDREPSGAFSPSDGLRSAIRLAKARVTGMVTIDDQVQDCVQIEGRAGDINHVFLNVLDNAIRAVGDAGLIRISATPENGCYVIRIADSGQGVEPSALEHIFEPFFTTRKAGDGTGLGLAIARQIIRQHGGEISVGRSELGGALFTVQLPVDTAGKSATATLH